MPSSEIRNHENKQIYHFYVDSQDEANSWISILMRCTLPFSFLSFSFHFYIDSQIHLYSTLVQSIFALWVCFPRLKVAFGACNSLDMPVPYRRALIWSKIRLMGLHFDFSKESESSYRDVKRTTLVELLDVVDSVPYWARLRCET